MPSPHAAQDSRRVIGRRLCCFVFSRSFFLCLIVFKYCSFSRRTLIRACIRCSEERSPSQIIFYYSFGTNERRLCAWSLCYDAWSTQLEGLLVRRTRFSNSMDIVSGKRLGEIVRLSQTIMRNLIWYFFSGGIYFSPSWRPNCAGVLWPASRNGPEVRALDRPVLWYPERSSLIVARRSTADIR